MFRVSNLDSLTRSYYCVVDAFPKHLVASIGLGRRHDRLSFLDEPKVMVSFNGNAHIYDAEHEEIDQDKHFDGG